MRTTPLLIVTILLAGLFGLLGIAGLGAQSFTGESVQLPSARIAAIGGVHVALNDDISTLFANPAGFRGVEPQLAASELTMNLAGPVFSIADLVLRASGGVSPVTLLSDPAVQSLLTSLYASAGLNGPISFGYVGEGLGFGFFNCSNVSFTTQGTVPTVTARVSEDFLFAGGYAFSIPLPASMKSTLDLGIELKAFARGTITLTQSILSILTLLLAPSPAILFGQPFALDVGIGVDVGVLYSWNTTISVGIVGHDLYAPMLRNDYGSFSAFSAGTPPSISYGVAPIDLSAGILYSPSLGALESYISGLKLMLDYGDILDFLTHPVTSTNPLLHIGAGVEVVLLEILSLRGGFSQGYFSAGLGLDLTWFQLNLSMYGSELSSEPGLRPVYNLLVGFEFRY
jgi:hypothetical protein